MIPKRVECISMQPGFDRFIKIGQEFEIDLKMQITTEIMKIDCYNLSLWELAG